jgi:DivIVA domain-containing protein
MTLTPADVDALMFPIVFRGYKVEAVDAFLDRLQAELAEALPDRPGETSTAAVAALDPAAPDDEPSAGTATWTPTESDGLAGRETGPAARALRTLTRAEELAEQMMADATAEADETRVRARVEAEEIISAAKAESERVEAELQLRSQRELGDLALRTHHLRAEIGRLSRVERQYREALQGLLSEQQLLLEQRPPVLDAETAAAVGAADDLHTAA